MSHDPLRNYRELAWQLNGGFYGNIVAPLLALAIKAVIVASVFWIIYKVIV